MKLEGKQKFVVPSTQVFNAILNPEVLKTCSGAEAISYSSPTQFQVEIAVPIPGLSGRTFEVHINITNKQAPNLVELAVAHKGRSGAINAACKISLVDEAGGSLLTYDGKVDLEGLLAVAENPLGHGIIKNKLADFFKNLEKELAKAHV
jgi:carbon monoxide dehydrogenase subunit G